MPESISMFDAYAPREIAQRVESVGVVKARMQTLPLAMLGVLAGAFIGLGSGFFVIVKSDPSLGFAAAQLAGGAVFSLGLLLVVVAGAELFTGNNLIVMAWADGRITAREVLRNWGIVALANLVGAAGLALLVYAAGHTAMNDGAIGRTVLRIVHAKMALSPSEAFFRGALCNVLVCMAVWMAMAGRSVVDKAVAILLPVAAFVAAGYEHSIANMYFFPLAMLIEHGASVGTSVTLAAMAANLLPVIAGNLLGGSVLVALTYYVIYRRNPAQKKRNQANSAALIGREGDAPREQLEPHHPVTHE
ncbi:MAG: formate/nitrite transporter family protein [Burkholderiales bacterium]|nr:formate/nitrite transporter family protein [Burkholderiales bacterium]